MVSVILPFYNSEKTLGRAILSVLHQDGVKIELLLVNNNSNDASLEVAEGYCSRYPNKVKLIHEGQQGVVHAMNSGLKSSQFDWVARMDSDDYWFPLKLKKQLDFAAANENIEVVGTQVQYASELDATEGFNAYVDWSNGISTAQDIELNIFCESPLVNPTILFQKHLIAKFGYYREGDFPEDYEMFLRWHSKGVKMAKVREVLMVWNDSGSRLTRTHASYLPEAFNRVKCAYLADWLKEHSPNGTDIWVWGAGRKTRKKLEELEKRGIQIQGFIDLKANRTSIKPCISFKEIRKEEIPFVVSFVSNRGKGNEIRQYLESKSFVEQEDFLIAG